MTTISEVLTGLVACLKDQITVDGSPDVCWIGVAPGAEISLDRMGDDCEGGMAWVRMALSYPAAAVGQADTSLANCAQGTGIDIEMGLIRIVPVEEEGYDPALSLAITEQQIKDMWTMRRAIKCCSVVEPNSLILGTYTPYGPQGDTLGGFWTAFIGLD